MPEPSYLLFRRAGSGVYVSGIYLYVYPRGAEQLGFIVIIIIDATIYRVVLYCAGEMVTMIELLLPGWLADDAGVRRWSFGLICNLASDVSIWRYAGSRVASGRVCLACCWTLTPFMR